MLQERVKAIKTVLGESFIKRLSQYLHDCVREEVKSSTFRNLKGDKDNKWIFVEGEEKAFTQFDKPLALNGSDSYLTELMIQSDMDTKDKYLIYGFLFLSGKNSKAKKNNEFLTPVLYAPCKLERQGTNILLNIQEDMLSLNTGALAQLMQKDDEEEVDAMLSGLLDVVPDLPLTQEGLEIFITTLKSLVPDIEITDIMEEDNKNDTADADDFYSEDTDFDALMELAKKPKVKVDKISLCKKQAVILTKRPNVTAGVLHELTQIADRPAGIIRENALNCINQEYLLSNNVIDSRALQKNKQNKDFKDFFPITPLSLSDSQQDVIRKIEQNDFLAVYGPPGTGKSQTIVNLAAHLIAQGKTVLVASRMDKAVDVVAQRLEELQAPYLALRAGRANYQKQLNYKLQDLLSGKVDLDDEFVDAILVDVSDMKTLLNDIKNLENSVEKIIKLEEQYTQTQIEHEEALKVIGEFTYIKKRLKSTDVM
jgi:Mrp family chromosome partitioning ATPase